MPPEPLPWERKDAAARKHDRCPQSDAPTGSSAGGPFPGPRWRDPHRGPREFYSPPPRRPPSGHHKQVYAEDAPPRSEDEGFRCYSGRYGSSSGRDGGTREGGRGYLRRSPWSGGERSSPSPSSSSSARDHSRVRVIEAVDDSSGIIGPRPEREKERDRDRDRDHSLGSISWKPLKWPRSGSFSSPGGPKAAAEGEEERAEVVGKESGPVMSPQSDSQPPVSADEGHSRKRHRLGWGQGLAKYEKEKVEAPSKTTAAISTETPSGSNPETAAEDGAIGSSSSPQGMDVKLHATIEATESKQCIPTSSDFMPEKCLLDSSVDIENLDFNTLSLASSSITDLLQAEEHSIGDLTSARQTALDRLLLLKDEISKLVEKAEAVVDSCEMELKNLNDSGEEIGSTHSTTKITDESDVPINVSHCTASLLSNRNDTASSNVASPVIQHENHLQSNLLAHDQSHIGSNMGKSHSTESHSTVEGLSVSGFRSIEVCVNCALDKTEEEAASQVLTCPLDEKVESDSSLNVGGAHSIVPLSVEVDSFVTPKIFDSNKEAAMKASEVFSDCAVRVSLSDAASHNVYNPQTGEKFMSWKRSLQFKEQVLTLKFKAFRHFWREDLRLLDLPSAKKNASKPQKRSEIRCCSTQSGSQKPRSSARSRLPVPARHVTLSPPAEILDMANKLISKSEIQMHRKNLKMPAMILDERERKHSMFVTSNGLVEDSLMMEKEKALINPWTEEEQELFKEKLTMFGKDFRKIASFLDSKTTADCIEFYYKNHKSEGFEAIRKVMASRKQSRSLPSANYMIASGRKWKDDTNTASLDVLGAASVFVSHSNDVAGHRQSLYNRPSVGGSNLMKIPRGGHAKIAVDSHAEATAADVLAGIGSAMSSEGISSCVTSSIDPMEMMESMPVDRPLFSEASQSIWEEDAFSDEGRGELETIDWSDDEKSVFIRALRLYGKDFARISCCLGTRSKEQCKIFYSKARKCLGLEMVYREPIVHEETPLSDVNGGRSDTDEGCAAEIVSMLCSTQSCSRVGVNWSVMKSDLQEAARIGSSCKNDKLDQMHITEEKSMQAFETNNENKSFVISQDIQSPETDPGSKKVTPEALEDSPLRNHSLESHIGQHVSDDEMNGQDTEMAVEMHQYGPKDMMCQPPGTDCSSNNVSKPESQLLPTPSASVKKLLRETCIDVTADPSLDNAMDDSYDLLPDTVLGHSVTLQKESNLPPLPRKKSQVMPWKRSESSPSEKAPLTDYKSLVFSGNDQALPLPLTTDNSDSKNPLRVSGGIRTSCAVSSQSSIGFDCPRHTLGGCPSHVLNVRSNGLQDLSPSAVSADNVPKKNGSSHRLLLPDLHSGKGNKTSVVNLESASTYARGNDEPGEEELLRSCSGDTSLVAEKPSARSGDVKLFGQILSHQSSLQKPDDSEVKPPSTKENRILNFQLPNGRPDGTSDPSNAESSSFLGLAELHRSFDWWDEQKTQAGLSSLANSALCLPKCPSVVSGVAYHPKKIKPVSSRSVVMPQSLFPAEGKGQIVFPELQNRVRIDAMSRSFQQPGRVAMNLISGGDAIGCAVVSDPVAALRLHFAQQITTSLGSSEEPHRGDLGNR